MVVLRGSRATENAADCPLSRAAYFGLIPVNSDFPLPYLPLQIPPHADLDRLARGGEDEGETDEVGDESGRDQEGPADEQHGAVDQVVPGKLPLLKFPLDVVDDPETLLTGVKGAHHTGEDDEEEGAEDAAVNTDTETREKAKRPSFQ